MIKPCRYLEGHIHADMKVCVFCAYHDEPLKDEETIKCYPGGWECYEEQGRGVIYEDGRWMSVGEYTDWLRKEGRELPDGIESWPIPNLPSDPPSIIKFVVEGE